MRESITKWNNKFRLGDKVMYKQDSFRRVWAIKEICQDSPKYFIHPLWEGNHPQSGMMAEERAIEAWTPDRWDQEEI